MGKRITYNQGNNLVDIIVRDDTGAKLDFFRARINDTNRIKEILRILKEKYGTDILDDNFFDF